MSTTWTLTAKDLRIYLRDPVGLALGLGLPIVLATVFGFAMGAMGGGDDGGRPRVRIVVEDLDASAASARLREELGSIPTLRLAEPDEGETAREVVAEGDAPVGLSIPAGYEASLAGGAPAPLVLLRDPSKEIEQQIALGSLVPALFRARGGLTPEAMGQGLAALGFPAGGRGEATAILEDTWQRMGVLAERHGDGSGPAPFAGLGGGGLLSAATGMLGLEVEDVLGGEHDDARKVGAQAHAVSGIAVMMLLFGLVACGGTLLQEEAEGTLDRLRLAPGAGGAILGGKFLFTWIVGMAQLVILFLYAHLVFDVPIFRSPLGLVTLSAAVAAAATGFGLLFAVVCRTRAQLEGLSTIVILTMSALGGAWWPLAITPEWYRFLGHFTLTAWAMDGYQGLFWYGHGPGGIALEIGVLLAIGAVTSLVASLAWHRRIARAG